MKTSHTGSESQTPAVALRQRAEGIAREKAIRIPENIESLSVEAARQMLHELRVHQIELEMQNEELRRAQTELNAARARYFDLYDLAPVGYCTLSEQKLILEANLTAATLLGVARGALVKQPITRFIFKQDQDLYYKHLKQLFESGEPQACELRMVKMDGAPVWVGLEATVAQDADGMPVCRAVLSDITKRKQSEEALRETRNYLDNLIDYANAPIITWDTEYRITRFNHAFERLTGYTAEEVSGRELFILFPETSCDESLNKIKRSSIGECWESMDLPIRRKDGVIRLVLWNSANIYAQDGKTIIANIAQGWDITERQQAEKALKESENNYRLLADNVNDVIFVLDMNLNYTYISPSVKILRGYEPEEVLKLSPIET
ncbi:MAG: PAS domain S-box protein [Deltaproteobacteria bacterium]|nr:PAS domain S-box protein [Deltaproteobacteria bacterium]